MAIKIYKSNDAGAPSLTGQAGSLITCLDAILVNGYNTVSVSSITRSGGIATVTTSAAHGLATGDSALIAGADQADYNIDAVVTVTGTTTFTYSVANTPTTPATGTITVKRAPAGFTKSFTGTNKAVYRANDLTSQRHYLRVLDDGGSSGGGGEARLWGYESMSDVDTGTNAYPTSAQSTNGYFWRKSSTTDTTARGWMVVTDGKIVYYFCDYSGTAAAGLSSNAVQYSGAFGDIISYKPGDAYGVLITGCTTANSTSTPPLGLMNAYTTISAPSSFASSMVLARDYTAVAGAKYVGIYATGLNASCIGSSANLSYPHLIDSGYYLCPAMITQATPSLIRGRLPGIWEGMHGKIFNNLDTITNIQGMMGRTFMMVYGINNSTAGHIMIDITGPWDS